MYDYFTAKVFVISVDTEYKSCSSDDLTLKEANQFVNDYVKHGFNIKDISVSFSHPVYMGDDNITLTTSPIGALYELEPDFVGNSKDGYFIDFYVKQFYNLFCGMFAIYLVFGCRSPP